GIRPRPSCPWTPALRRLRAFAGEVDLLDAAAQSQSSHRALDNSLNLCLPLGIFSRRGARAVAVSPVWEESGACGHGEPPSWAREAEADSVRSRGFGRGSSDPTAP